MIRATDRRFLRRSVAAQWTYDAYGAVVAGEVFDATSPVNRCGHKGLFADRLDVGVP